MFNSYVKLPVYSVEVLPAMQQCGANIASTVVKSTAGALLATIGVA